MSKPKVSVIIPHYSEDKTFLHLCLKSLMQQTYANLEIIVSSSSEVTPTELYPNIRLYQSKERMHYAQSINKGVTIALEAQTPPEFLVLGNDDTIYSKGAIEALVSVASSSDCILNGFSNCDNGFTHFANICLKEGDKILPFKSQVELKEIEGFESILMNMGDGEFGPQMFIQSALGFVCFYATLIPVKTWMKLGVLDEQFVTAGCEDADYCFRAKQQSIPVGWTPYAFIFHFGGKTSNLYTTQEERVTNQEKFNKKWNIV